MTTLRQLEYLVAIVEHGSFTRAAEVLHVTQPALSHQVRELERAMGGPLLERLPRTVRLTPIGREMLPHARATLADAERARRAARRACGLEAGELRLATVHSVTLGLLPPVLRAWRQQHPAVQVRLREHQHHDELLAGMLAGDGDIAVGPPPAAWHGPMREIGVEEFVVVLPTDDPAISEAGARIALRRLAERAWVHYTPDHGLAEFLDHTCAAAGFQPRVAVRTGQAAAVPLLAAAGLGPALVPASIIPPHFDGQVLRPDPPIRRPLAAYTRTRPDPLTTAFTEVLTRTTLVMPPHVRERLRLSPGDEAGQTGPR